MKDEALISQYVEMEPRRPSPAEARLRDSGVPIWAVVGHYLAVDRDLYAVAHDYDISFDEVAAAVAYYRRHRQVIDARLAENSAAVS